MSRSRGTSCWRTSSSSIIRWSAPGMIVGSLSNSTRWRTSTTIGEDQHPRGLLHSSVRHGKFGLASLGLTVAGGRLTLPSASKRLVQLDHGGELLPRGRGEVQLRAEELALGVEDVELGGEPTLVAESGQ